MLMILENRQIENHQFFANGFVSGTWQKFGMWGGVDGPFQLQRVVW
jgi:hypothetical protein